MFDENESSFSKAREHAILSALRKDGFGKAEMQPHWSIMRFREDKKHPNGMRTAKSVWESIVSPVFDRHLVTVTQVLEKRFQGMGEDEDEFGEEDDIKR